MNIDITPWINLLLLVVLGALVAQTFSTLRQIGRDLGEIKELLGEIRRGQAGRAAEKSRLVRPDEGDG